MNPDLALIVHAGKLGTESAVQVNCLRCEIVEALSFSIWQLIFPGQG